MLYESRPEPLELSRRQNTLTPHEPRARSPPTDPHGHQLLSAVAGTAPLRGGGGGGGRRRGEVDHLRVVGRGRAALEVGQGRGEAAEEELDVEALV